MKEASSLHNKIIAACLAAMGTIGLPSAASAAPGLDLSIYGVGHLSADSIKTGTDSNGYIHSNSSRLGFRGGYDLGKAGTTAIFQYESGVDLTGHGAGDGNGGATSGGQIFTRARDSFVGVKGGFGTAVVGRLAAHNQWVYDYNLFADQVGDLGNLWGQNQPGRFDSAVQYRTPDFGGFSAALTYDPSGNQGADDMSSTIVKLNFAKGGLNLGAAFANYEQGTAAADDHKAVALTGSYDFGTFNIGGGFQQETDIGGVAGADRNGVTLGAALKLGNGVVKIQYARADELDNAANTGAKQIAIGYDHAWTKEITLYAAYARTTNDSAATFQSYNWGHGNQGVPAVVAGQSPKVFSIGAVYKFDMGLLGKR